MFRLTLFALLFAAAALAFAACGDGGDANDGNGANGPDGGGPTATSTAPSTVDEDLPAVAAAKEDLLQYVDVTLEEIETVSVTPMTFSDACLDVTYLTDQDEVCAQVITPGYEIVFRAGATQYEYHTDESGSNVRISGVDVGG